VRVLGFQAKPLTLTLSQWERGKRVPIGTHSQLYHCAPVLVLHVLRYGQEDLGAQRV